MTARLPIDLTSPAAAFAWQARIETALDSVVTEATRATLATARRLAADGLYALSEAPLADVWTAEIRTRLAVAVDAGTLPAVVAMEVRPALVDSTLPGEVYDSARAVLLAAGEQQWDARTTTAALADALSVETPTAVLAAARIVRAPKAHLATRGHTWRASMDEVVRTTATGTAGRTMSAALHAVGFAEKRWVARHDRVTREAHAAADGVVVPVGQSFVVGDGHLQYPGDPAGPVGEIVNCRCVMVGVGQPTSQSPLFIAP